MRYPAETSHGLSRNGPIDLRVDRLQRIGGWLDKHLQTAKPAAAAGTKTKSAPRTRAARAKAK